MSFGPQHETVDDGAGGTMIQANYAPKGKKSFRRHYNCQICGFTYPEDEVILDDSGAAYCLRFNHYEEIGKPTGGSFLHGGKED